MTKLSDFINYFKTIASFIMLFLIVSCAGTDNRALQEEHYALLEDQRIAAERTKQENIRDALRAPMQTESSIQSDINPQQFIAWEFRLSPDLATSNQTCTLLSEPSKIMNGDLPTIVQVIVTATNIYLRSDAVLSPDDIESGFRVDTGLPVAFDAMFNEVTASVDRSYTRLINSMLTGTILTAYFSYKTSNKTPTNLKRIDLNLDEFNQAYEMLSSCQ